MAHPLARLTASPVAVLLALLLVPLPVAAAAPTDFPAGFEGYHTYAELTEELAAVEAAHPDLVRRFSIGQSYEGRELWAAKVSDNVAVDEAEPEVLFDGLHHADEHMGLEMTLAILHWLVDGYGTDYRITRAVNEREIWIVFAVNPDGAEYDISGGRFHLWRKNRQPNPGSPYIGTDLNRNYGYRWGGGGRTSSNPQAITYRGSSAFSAPETQAMRDFLASRVVDGRQQIRMAITFHEYGRLVMWPYGYTSADVPGDMTTDDHAALVAIGRRMAAYNGYRAQQASDLYITSGTTRDYEYGRYRIFPYTVELSIRDYPDDALIASETGRNRMAVIYLLERASCPYSVLGSTATRLRCGAFDDDLEVSRGWTVDPDGTDTAPANARWIRGNPAGTSVRGVPIQLDRVISGTSGLVTGRYAGSNPWANDLDGVTTVRSPEITLPAATGQQLMFRWSFAHDAKATSADWFRAQIETADGARVTVFNRSGRATLARGGWRTAWIPLDAWAGQTIRIVFGAADGGAGNLVEAQVDDVRVTRPG